MDESPRRVGAVKYLTEFTWARASGPEASERHYVGHHVPLIRRLYRADELRVAYYTGKWDGERAAAGSISGPSSWRYSLTWQVPGTSSKQSTQLMQQMRQDIPACLEGMERYRVEARAGQGDYCDLQRRSAGIVARFRSEGLDGQRALERFVGLTQRYGGAPKLIAVGQIVGTSLIESAVAPGQVDTGCINPVSEPWWLLELFGVHAGLRDALIGKGQLLRELVDQGASAALVGGCTLIRQHDARCQVGRR